MFGQTGFLPPPPPQLGKFFGQKENFFRANRCRPPKFGHARTPMSVRFRLVAHLQRVLLDRQQGEDNYLENGVFIFIDFATVWFPTQQALFNSPSRVEGVTHEMVKELGNDLTTNGLPKISILTANFVKMQQRKSLFGYTKYWHDKAYEQLTEKPLANGGICPGISSKFCHKYQKGYPLKLFLKN